MKQTNEMPPFPRAAARLILALAVLLIGRIAWGLFCDWLVPPAVRQEATAAEARERHVREWMGGARW